MSGHDNDSPLGLWAFSNSRIKSNAGAAAAAASFVLGFERSVVEWESGPEAVVTVKAIESTLVHHTWPPDRVPTVQFDNRKASLSNDPASLIMIGYNECSTGQVQTHQWPCTSSIE